MWISVIRTKYTLSETKLIKESRRLDGDLKQVASDLLLRMIKQFLSIAWIYFDSAKANGECIKWSFLMLDCLVDQHIYLLLKITKSISHQDLFALHKPYVAWCYWVLCLIRSSVMMVFNVNASPNCFNLPIQYLMLLWKRDWHGIPLISGQEITNRCWCSSTRFATVSVFP